MNRYVTKTYADIVKLFIRRLFVGRPFTKRSLEHVDQEHSKAWRNHPESSFFGKQRIQNLNGSLVIYRAIDHRKFFLEYILERIGQTGPRHIVELGSGLGINILAIAALMPEIQSFRGVELTQEGVKGAEDLLKNVPLNTLAYLTELPHETILERLSNRDIKFVVGDITKELPFKDQSTDYIFTTWVLEQLPSKFRDVLDESRRILSDKGEMHFLEHFKEAQRNIFQRMHLANMDYFRSSIHELEIHNLKIIKFESIPLDKIKFSSGSLILGKKNF